TIGLLAYLYGPGKYEEHTDPHLVASWDDNAPAPSTVPRAGVAILDDLAPHPGRGACFAGVEREGTWRWTSGPW
ncbi:mobilization protein, partial [Streptomyces sp. NPDC048551]